MDNSYKQYGDTMGIYRYTMVFSGLDYYRTIVDYYELLYNHRPVMVYNYHGNYNYSN